MSHETAQQRRRRHRSDPYRGQILAPKAVHMPNVGCLNCTHPELIHRPPCLRVGCECTEYVKEE